MCLGICFLINYEWFVSWLVQVTTWFSSLAKLLHSIIIFLPNTGTTCSAAPVSQLFLLASPASMWSPWIQPLWSWALTWGWWRCKWWRRERKPPGTAGQLLPLQTSIHCRWPQPHPDPETAGLCKTPLPGFAGSLVGGCQFPLLVPSPGLQCNCRHL